MIRCRFKRYYVYRKVLYRRFVSRQEFISYVISLQAVPALVECNFTKLNERNEFLVCHAATVCRADRSNHTFIPLFQKQSQIVCLVEVVLLLKIVRRDNSGCISSRSTLSNAKRVTSFKSNHPFSSGSMYFNNFSIGS